uniref:Uncharacterized protein n=1 Tax=uncultured marine virus TaxID=186617 RepID=A0A0F7L9D3_9VIRU|nr:hypothetical protein [uncultured marine virus]
MSEWSSLAISTASSSVSPSRPSAVGSLWEQSDHPRMLACSMVSARVTHEGST